MSSKLAGWRYDNRISLKPIYMYIYIYLYIVAPQTTTIPMGIGLR